MAIYSKGDYFYDVLQLCKLAGLALVVLLLGVSPTLQSDGG